MGCQSRSPIDPSLRSHASCRTDDSLDRESGADEHARVRTRLHLRARRPNGRERHEGGYQMGSQHVVSDGSGRRDVGRRQHHDGKSLVKADARRRISDDCRRSYYTRPVLVRR